MKLYCTCINLGSTWRNVWCATQAEAIKAASGDDVVVAVYTVGDKASGVELLNNSDMHHTNFEELDGIKTVEKVWPKTLRR